MIDLQLLVGVIQAEAIAHSVWRGSLDVFADVTLRACGQTEYSQQDLEKVRALLRGQPLRAALQARDILAWIGHDGLLRLVDATPLSLRAARLRIAHHPGPLACRFCMLQESPRLPELIQEKGPDGGCIAGSFLHEQCFNAWRRLQMQIAASEVNSK